MPKKQKLAVKDYEAIGRMVENIYEYNYANRWRAARMSFLKGIAGGFGGVVGATVVVAILLWTLSLLHHVPFVNRVADNVRHIVQQSDTSK